MKGFQDIRGLPYCVGAVNSTNIRWLTCPDGQFYEYRCYKEHPSVVIFAVVTANRRFIYVDVGRPGVLGDSTIYDRSMLRSNIDSEKWMGAAILDLVVSSIPIRPYLMGYCAFTLNVNMMKTASSREKVANPVLKHWNEIASQTRKPVECAFGMLKQRFLVVKKGVRLYHEDDITKLCIACMMFHNMAIEDGVFDDFVLRQDENEDEEESITAECTAKKRQKDVLIYYVVTNVQNRD